GDEHHLIAILDQAHIDDGTVALARVDEDDPLASAVLNAELVDVGALAVAVFANGEHVAPIRIGHRHADDLILLADIDRFDAHRPSPHRAHLRLGEPNAHPALGRDDELTRAVGDRGGEQLIAVLDLHADDAFLAEVFVLVDLGLLDLPTL